MLKSILSLKLTNLESPILNRLILLFLILFTLQIFPFAQQTVQAQRPSLDPNNLYFEYIPTQSSYDFLQDQEGFFWIVSGEVVRYDGYSFKNYPELPTSAALYEDQTGLLWFMNPEGLTRYDKNNLTIHTYKVNPDDAQALPGGFNYHYNQYAAEDSRGDLWFATTNGLSRFDRSKEIFENFFAATDSENNLLDNNVMAVLSAQDGMLWVGTKTGLHKFDPATGQVIKRYPQMDNDPNALHGDMVASLWEDEQGILWVGTSDGLNRLDPQSETFNHYVHDKDDPATLGDNDIRTLFISQDAPHLLWIGTWDDGLNLLETDTGRIIRYVRSEQMTKEEGIDNSQIFKVRQSQSGAIWVLAITGLYHLDTGAHPFVSYNSGDPDNPRSLAPGTAACIGDFDRNGNLWIVSAGGGLNRIDRKSGQVSHFLGNSTAPLKSTAGALWVVEDGSLWLADENKGLIQIDPLAERILKEVPADMGGKPFHSLIDATNSDLLWAGSLSKGLFKFNRRTEQADYLPIDPEDPTKISAPLVVPTYQDEDGYIWIDEVGAGLSKFDPHTEQVVANYQHDPNNSGTLASNMPQQLYVDSQNRYWVSHLELGPDLFDPETGIFERFVDRYNQKWPIKGSTGMLEDNRGDLWVSGFLTDQIVRFNPDTGDIRVFTGQDGVAILGCGSSKARKADDGRFWFFGREVTTFYPEQVVDNPYRPPVYFTKLSQAGQPIQLETALELAQEIQLSWDSNFFEFEVAALNYRHPEQNQYQYKLAGWDDEWFQAETRRFGRYTGLEEGMYALQVKGSNNDGVWSDQMATLNITVEPNIPAGQTLFTLSEMQAGGAIQLPFDQNSFTIEALPLDYDLVGQDITYMLTGYDEAWQDLGSHRYVSYKNVMEGDYTFKVKQGQKEILSKAMTIRPPFIRSNTFYGLTTFGVILLFGSIYFVSLNQLRSRQTLRESQLQAEAQAERAATMNTLNTISQQVTGILDLDKLLVQVVTLTKETFDYYHTQIYLLNPARNVLVLAAGYGEVGEKMKAEGYTIPLDDPTSLTARTARERQPFLLDDIQEEPASLAPPLLPQVKSKLAMPIIQEGQVVGVISVYSDQTAGLDQNDHDLLQSLANQVAIAMTNAGLFEQTEQARHETQEALEEAEGLLKRLETTATLSGYLVSILDFEQLLQEFVTQVKERFDYYHVHVYILDEGEQDLQMQAGYGEPGRIMKERGHHIPLNAQTSLVARAARNRKVVHIDDVRQIPDWLPNELLPETRSEMAVPIIAEDKVIGVLDVQSKWVAGLDQGDAGLLQSVANQVAVAIANVELFEEVEAARQSAEVANRAKSDFLSSMSHELRTPLNGILGYTQILKRSQDLSPIQQDGLNIIHQSGEHLLTLINDILDLSKIEAGKLELYPKDFRFSEFLNGVSGIIRIRAQNKGIGFVLNDIPPLPQTVYADEKRLRQVLINLITNAVKFTDQGSVTLRVTPLGQGKLTTLSDSLVRLPESGQGRDEREGYRLRFEVIDTGIGITAEEMEQIFTPFEQVGDVQKRAEGTGLGLSITRRLLEMMGSSLQVESEPGRGSNFFFEILLPEAERPVIVEKKTVSQEIIGYEGPKRRVLVVDDKAHNRAVVFNILAPLGFEVLQADNAQTGIELALETRPDLILMDMIMPNMTGFEAVQKMRQMPAFKETLIVGSSASVFEEDRHKVRLAGCDAFLAKPVAVKRLLDMLTEYLELEWIYDQTVNVEATEAEVVTHSEQADMMPPPIEKLTELHQLAVRGTMRRIKKWAAALAQTDPQYRPFANKLQELAKGFQSKRIVALVEEYIEIERRSEGS